MGISIEIYRLRVGMFARGRLPKKKLGVRGLHFSKGMLAFSVLTVLLRIAGIESNPRPISNEQLMAKMEEMSDKLGKGMEELKTELHPKFMT